MLDAINNRINDFISLPSLPQQKVITAEIEEKHGFPQCVGFLDGCLIPVPKPANSGTAFITRKTFAGLNSQFLVDSKFCIRDIVVGKLVKKQGRST